MSRGSEHNSGSTSSSCGNEQFSGHSSPSMSNSSEEVNKIVKSPAQSERETAKQTLSGLPRLRATPKEKPVGAEETLHKQRSHQQFALHHYCDFSLLQFSTLSL